jgi:hypothetical protein
LVFFGPQLFGAYASHWVFIMEFVLFVYFLAAFIAEGQMG